MSGAIPCEKTYVSDGHLGDRRVRAGDPLEPVGAAAPRTDVEDHPHEASQSTIQPMAREIDADGLEAAGDVQLVDVRTQEERDAGRIPDDTAHIPFDELLARAGELDKEHPIVFYCRVGRALRGGRRRLRGVRLRRRQPGGRDRRLAGVRPPRRGRDRPAQRAAASIAKYLNPDRVSCC